MIALTAVKECPTPVRVVILNFNRPHLTVRCVHSVLGQRNVTIELVVVDNWSNEAQLVELRSALPAGITLLENKVNRGYAAGNNTGLRLQEKPADFALVLNNDTVLIDPHTISTLVNALRNNAALAACSPLVHDAECGILPEASIQVRRIPNFWELITVSSAVLRRLPGLRRIHRRQVYADARPFPLNTVVPTETINGCCFLIRMSTLEAIGYLDEGTFLYSEELILGFQLRASGFGCALVTQTVVQHEQGASTGTNAAGSNVTGMLRRIRSEIYFARAYLGAGVTATLLIAVVGLFDICCKVMYSGFRNLK